MIQRLELVTALGAFSLATAGTPFAPEPPDAHAGGPPALTLSREAERADTTLAAAMARHIEGALTISQGRIEGPFGAARRLRVNPHTLRARMRKLGIDWKRYRQPVP